MQNKKAVIDIGSNTVRLVIYEFFEDGRFREVENVKAVARLRTYLNNDNILGEEGIHILLKILNNFKEVLEFHRIHDIRCVATATIRQSQNQNEIIAQIHRETDISIELLSEEDEAFYGYYAVAQTTPIETGITIDIGGGSTELTYFENKKLVHSFSFPFGVVSLKQQFIKGQRLDEEELSQLQHFIHEQLSTLNWLKDRAVPIVMIGGSARNVAQVNQHQENYPIAGVHQYTMTAEQIFSLREQLYSLSIDDLEKVEGLSKDRADIILPAIEVFYQLFQYSNGTYIMFSRKGLRDGLILEELNGKHMKKMTVESVIGLSLRELGYDYNIDHTHSQHMVYLASMMWEELVKHKLWEQNAGDLQLLKYGAYLYYLGEYIDSDSISQHTFYILANRAINGFFHRDRVKIAGIASYKNKSILKQFLEPFSSWFSKEEIKNIRDLGALLKFVYSLNATKRNVVKKLEISSIGQSRVVIDALCSKGVLAERYQAEKQKKHLEKAIKKDVVINFVYLD